MIGDSPTAPDPVGDSDSLDQSAISDTEPGRYLWAYNLIFVDPEDDSFEIIPLREATGHWNVLKFLEQGPCTNCVTINGITTNASGNKEFVVGLMHPFTNPNLTGFDVRGIAMFADGYTFGVSGHTTGLGSTGELVNADGYTSLYTAVTAGSGPAGLEGYLKGKFASLTVPNATLNGYKRHISSGTTNTRNAFYAGDTITSTYEIKMPTSAFIFGYAVDASWAPPTTTPVTDPMTEFPPDANCLEPWKIVVNQSPVGAGPTELGGKTVLQIDVYDWQGMGSIHPPVVECSDLFSGTKTAYPIGDFGDYSRWGAEIENLNFVSPGSYKCLISVEDVENSIMPAWIDLTGYQVVNVTVNSSAGILGGWAQTWGGIGEDIAANVAVDNWGNVYVAGGFIDTVDFDPGSPVDNHSSGSVFHDAYVSKFDNSGNFLWAKTWGDVGMDLAKGVVVDVVGSVYVAGGFKGTVDFDPGTGTQNRTSGGDFDSFILKLDSTGAFEWVNTWGGSQNCVVLTLSNNGLGDLYAGGYFEGTCDFDPGPGSATQVSNGSKDAYCVKYDYISGTFFSVYSFGGTGYDICTAIDAFGSSSFVYMAGYFEGSTDFDPGPLTDLHVSNGSADAFLCQLGNTSNNWLWARTWGGADTDECLSVAATSTGRAYVTGYFSITVDFDPGAGTLNKTSNGLDESFMTMFDATGSHVDAVTWGGTGDDEAYSIIIDESNHYVFVSGQYESTCDFDTGGGTDNRTSAGNSDCFVTRFDTTGSWDLTRTWGGSKHDRVYGAAVQSSTGNIFIVGIFGDTVNFDLSGGTDNHTAVAWADMFVAKYSSDINW